MHELGCENYSKCYVFKGTKDITAKQLEVGVIECNVSKHVRSMS